MPRRGFLVAAAAGHLRRGVAARDLWPTDLMRPPGSPKMRYRQFCGCR